VESLKGKVVEVLNEYTIAIDLGTKHGVKVGDRFVVYELGDMIKDVDGRDLERLELVKGQVEITHVQDVISQGASFSVETKTYYPFGSWALGPQEYKEKVTHKLAEVPTKSKKTGPVKVGDLVRRVYEV